MHIAYYITAHGYGHALRAVTIARSLSPSTRITFVSNVPERFFREELERPFSCRVDAFDCGCIQTDSVTIDVGATLETYRRIAADNRGRIDAEVVWCRNQGITGIVADIPPFAFEIARTAGLPSIGVTNFTWYDIYREYIIDTDGFYPELRKIHDQYTSAGLLLALSPASPMPYFPVRRIMPAVARKGEANRGALQKRFGIAADKRLALIYLGDFGMSSADWSLLASFSGWEFFGLQEIPGSSSNYHQLSKSVMWYPDAIASVDCVVSKLGYGVVAECMANGTPLLFLPRPYFAEYPVLERAVTGWGGGVRLAAEAFYRLDWGDALDRLSDMHPPAFPADGASMCAAAIESFFS